MTKATFEEIEDLIDDQRKNVKYDTKEFTLELIVSKFKRDIEGSKNKEIFIPFYQRKFVWDEERQSKFIESLIIGMPIPPLYFAEVEDGVLEIIDGVQRVRTINDFLINKLKLKGLKKLPKLNGLHFNDLSTSRKRKINNISIRAVVVTDIEKEEMNIRHEIFERLNTGGETLTKMENKKGSKEGKFLDFIYSECSENTDLNILSDFTKNDELRAYKEEFLVKYFAFSETMNFASSINDFLDNYIEQKNKDFSDDQTKDKYLEQFRNMLKFVKENKLILDIKVNRKNRLLAVFIGTTLALKENINLLDKTLSINVYNEKFIENSKNNSLLKLKENSNLVKNIILGSS